MLHNTTCGKITKRVSKTRLLLVIPCFKHVGSNSAGSEVPSGALWSQERTVSSTLGVGIVMAYPTVSFALLSTSVLFLKSESQPLRKLVDTTLWHIKASWEDVNIWSGAYLAHLSSKSAGVTSWQSRESKGNSFVRIRHSLNAFSSLELSSFSNWCSNSAFWSHLITLDILEKVKWCQINL